MKLKEKVLREVAENFSRVEEVSEMNTLKVLNAMRELKVSDAHFELLARIFKTESALV